MSKLDLLERLDTKRLQNAAGIDGKHLGRPFDAENKYSLPYLWSYSGIAVNRKVFKDPITSWFDLT